MRVHVPPPTALPRRPPWTILDDVWLDPRPGAYVLPSGFELFLLSLLTPPPPRRSPAILRPELVADELEAIDPETHPERWLRP